MMPIARRQAKKITRLQDFVENNAARFGLPWHPLNGVGNRPVVDSPSLGPLDLDHDNIGYVVVHWESAAIAGRHHCSDINLFADARLDVRAQGL